MEGELIQESIDKIKKWAKPQANDSQCDAACYPRVTLQQLMDAGLNPFAVQLLSESIAACKAPSKMSFRFKNVGITIVPLCETQEG